MSRATKETQHEATLTDGDIADFLQIGVHGGFVKEKSGVGHIMNKVLPGAAFEVEISIVPEDSKTTSSPS